MQRIRDAQREAADDHASLTRDFAESDARARMPDVVGRIGGDTSERALRRAPQRESKETRSAVGGRDTLELDLLPRLRRSILLQLHDQRRIRTRERSIRCGRLRDDAKSGGSMTKESSFRRRFRPGSVKPAVSEILIART